MRSIAQFLLILFAFAAPWEFSLELGEPFGPVARILGILLLVVAIPAVLQARRMRTPGSIQWAVLALYLWFCCSFFWTTDQAATLEKLRAYFQEMMIVWLVWEFADSPRHLRWLLRAYVAGSWVLSAVTLANFASPEAIAAGQIRFVAEGLDPNDTARFLDIGFPLAAVLIDSERARPARLLAWGYFPLGLFAVVLTASRGGVVAAALALAAAALLVIRSHPMRALAGAAGLLTLGAVMVSIVPLETLERLATISEQLQGGNLNERVNIWEQGWQAFVQAPLIGSGAGSFVSAAGTAPIDTAHNTALSIAVGGGLCALFLAAAILVLAIHTSLSLRVPLFLALTASLLVWIVTSLTASAEENRTTWLLFAIIACAGRLEEEEPDALAAIFPACKNPRARLAAGHLT